MERVRCSVDNDGDGDGSGSVAPSSYSSDTPSLGVNVDPQGLSLGAIGLDGNSSLTDLAMENKEVVGGALEFDTACFAGGCTEEEVQRLRRVGRGLVILGRLSSIEPRAPLLSPVPLT